MIKAEKSRWEHSMYLPYLIIRIQPNRINITSDSSLKKDRFLRNDPKARPKIMKSYLGNINSINNNIPSTRFHQSKENLNQSGLSTPSSANNTNFFSPIYA